MRYGGPCSEPHDEERMFEHARNSVRLAGNHIYAPDSSRVMQLWNTVGRVQADMCATGNRSSLTAGQFPTRGLDVALPSITLPELDQNM